MVTRPRLAVWKFASCDGCQLTLLNCEDELLPIAGIDYLGPLPPDIQHVTVFSGGIHTGAKEVDAAKALVKFITAPAAVPVIKKKGMEPG